MAENTYEVPEDYVTTGLQKNAASSTSQSVSNLSGVAATTNGQIPVWTGAIFEAGTLLSGSGILATYVSAPSIGLQFGINAATLKSALGLPKDNFTAVTNPTVNSDLAAGFAVGSQWINTALGNCYQCVDSTTGAAVWKLLS